jgi:hypothetical protein
MGDHWVKSLYGIYVTHLADAIATQNLAMKRMCTRAILFKNALLALDGIQVQYSYKELSPSIRAAPIKSNRCRLRHLVESSLSLQERESILLHVF